MSKHLLLGGDTNTLVCNCFSDAYFALNHYLLTEGSETDSRLGPTYETLNFKTVIQQPLKRCTVSKNRRSNIFFHLAESLWVLTGRDDLKFVNIFNSRFPEYSDDGKVLHGAYGKRMRTWKGSDSDTPIDQLFTVTSILNEKPILRRLVISLWNPKTDLGSASKDLPCNTQLVPRIKENDLYLTIFNRSNDLHWGYVANIFQFSFLGEIMATLLDKNYVRQTHFSQSLHSYLDNGLIHELEDTDIHIGFYDRYPPSAFNFDFEYSTSKFSDRFNELDYAVKELVELLLKCNADTKDSWSYYSSKIEAGKLRSRSVYEISYLLTLYVCYKKEYAATKDKEIQDQLRVKYARYLTQKNESDKFLHADYFAMALNYFVSKLTSDSRAAFIFADNQMGHY